MAYPLIAGRSDGTQASDSSSWSLTYPTGIKPGELLIAIVGVDGNTTVSSMPAGWVHSGGTSNTAEISGIVAKKLADGTESGSFTLGLSAAQQGSWRVFRVQRWEGTLGTNFTNSDPAGGSVPNAGANSGSDASAENVAITPFNWSLNTEETLVFLINAIDGTETGSTPPTNYSTEGSAQSSGGSTGAGLYVAQGNRTGVVTEFPGATTLTGAEDWTAMTVAVRPGTLAGVDTPVDSASVATSIITAGTSHGINVGSPVAGTLLIVLVRFAGAPGAVTFTGYTQIKADTSDASDDDTRIYYRLADGTEGANDTLSTGNSIKLAAIAWEVTGAADPAVRAPEASAATVGTAANINPGSFSPTLGALDYLFITIIGMDSETATATKPAGYLGTAVTSNSGTAGAVATNCMIWGVSRPTSQVTTEDPAAWTSSAPANGVTAITVAVPPPPPAANTLNPSFRRMRRSQFRVAVKDAA